MVDENGYDWSALAKIAPPNKWLLMYADYQDILIKEDVAGFWQEQYFMANTERELLKKELEHGKKLDI